MGGKGYSSDDNRSMQLNDNNDRYYSSRGIDRDDYDDDSIADYVGISKKAQFKGFIDLEDFLPYFERWIKNLRINFGKGYETEIVINGLPTKHYVPHFVGFTYFDKEQAITWGYYRTRALIDYLNDKNLSWTRDEEGIIEYRVQNWFNFGYRPENIMWANRFIYEQNGLEFVTRFKQRS